jgi:hypothetical protein
LTEIDNITGMTERRPRRPRDPNQLAKRIVDIATGEVDDTDSPSRPVDPSKNPHAVELGRLGGKKGGVARAKSLTRERRSEIAKRAADSRWNKS